MKKTYVKPMIQFEDFKIASNIAAACERKVSANEDSCYIAFGEEKYFTNNSICDTIDGIDESGFCYQVPIPSTVLFGS